MGVLPLPPGQKFPPPQGFTGWHSPDADDAQVETWREVAADHNIGLRMPEGVIGIDIDHYGEKRGLDTIELAESKWGRLPETWVSTSRWNDSGIRFFRVPEGSRFPGKLEIDGLSDVEVIQRGHRFAVVHPSVHPSGSQYHWYMPEDFPAVSPDYVPKVSDLPDLPESWIQGLQANGRLFGVSGEKRTLTSDDALKELLSFHDALAEQPCKAIKERLEESVLRLGEPGARHDACLLDSMALVGMGHLGHVGVVTALEELQAAFIALVSADRDGADAEYDRMIHGALARLEGEPVKVDPCDLEDGEFEKAVEDKVYRMRVTEEAKIRFNNILAGEIQLPHLESAEELALAVPQTPDWLVKDLIPRDGVITITAQKKVGKTTVVHKLLEAILNGGTFLETFQCFPPTGSMCIFDLEMPRDKLGEWIRRNGIAHHDVYATSLRGKATHFNIMNENHRRAIADDLKEKNCKLLVVDPLGPYLRMTGAEENSTSEGGRAFDAVVSLKQEANVDTLIIPLHAGHNDKTRARGASVFGDIPDVLISLYKKNDNDDVRHFSATGRDVDVNTLSFTYDTTNGEITMLEGGTPDDARDEDVLSVLDILENVSAVSQNQIVKAMKTRLPGCGPSRAKTALAQAIKREYVRTEKTADTPKAPINHDLTDKGRAELAKERKVLGEAA